MSSNRIKKKSFILLELLIAFSLVICTIVPFTRYPLHQIKKETDFLFQMELERVANNMLCSLMEKIFSKELPEETLFTKSKILKFDDLEKEIEVSFPKIAKRKYFCEKSIHCCSTNTRGNQEFAKVALIVKIYEKEKNLIDAKQELVVSRKSTKIKPAQLIENPKESHENNS